MPKKVYVIYNYCYDGDCCIQKNDILSFVLTEMEAKMHCMLHNKGKDLSEHIHANLNPEDFWDYEVVEQLKK